MYKILVADDEKDIVSLLKDYFEINDYTVITAYNGNELIEKLSYYSARCELPEGDSLLVYEKIQK